MNFKLENFLLFLVVVTDITRTVTSFDSKCSPLRIINGRSRYRGRGRIVRFNCMRGFQLVGVKYATCMSGKWDADVPICVKYGCRAPSTTHVNGQFIESYRGAVVKIVCNPGYALVGSPSVYCNGLRWNETFPVCRVNNLSPALSCDFESIDLCGWSQDPMHDFDWKRQVGSTLSGNDRIGPAFDHTKGENNTGYYMYVESSNARMENDMARLYSPVYFPKHSNGTCFKFWYYMYGATTGFLKVYVKPEGVELFNLIPSFWINGEQGKSWVQSFFPIEHMESNFQIVIEGVREPGAVGDIAFDDVQITSVDECKMLQEMTSSTEFPSSVNSDDDVIDIFSCKNRCNEGKVNSTGSAAEDEKCNCYESCDKDGTCCSDYFNFCSVSHSSSTITAKTESKTSLSLLSSPTSPTKPEERFFSKTTTKLFLKTTAKPPEEKPSPSLEYNNESNEIPIKPELQVPSREKFNQTINDIPSFLFPTSSKNASKTTTSQTEQKISDAKNETKIATTVSGAKVAQKQVLKVEKKTEDEEKDGLVPNPGTNRAKIGKVWVNAGAKNRTTEELKEVEAKVLGKEDTKKSTTVTSWVSTATAKEFRSAKPNNMKFQKTFLEKPSTSNLANEFKFNKSKQKEASAGKEPPQAIKIDGSEDNSGGIILEIVEIGGTVIAILIIIVLGIFWYKRREHRKAERENMVEDSDVRFLTSDEALDFTLARPADDDL